MQTTPPSLPHSGMGIASFIIGLVASLGLLVTFGVAGVADSTQPGGLDEASVMAGVLGLLMVLFALAQLVALGLGIAGLVQAGRNKILSVLGTVFASTALLGSLMLMLLGVILET